MKATYVRDLDGFAGTAKLWKLDRSLVGERVSLVDGEPTRAAIHYDHVITSAADVMFSGPETYIFPADEAGEVASWGELDGSYRGDLNHDRAISGFERAHTP